MVKKIEEKEVVKHAAFQMVRDETGASDDRGGFKITRMPKGDKWKIKWIEFGFQMVSGETCFTVLFSYGQNGRARLLITYIGVDFEGDVLFDGAVKWHEVGSTVQDVLNKRQAKYPHVWH